MGVLPDIVSLLSHLPTCTYELIDLIFQMKICPLEDEWEEERYSIFYT